VARGLSDSRVVVDRGAGCIALADHDLDRCRGARQAVHWLGDEVVGTGRNPIFVRSAGRVRRERHLACPIEAETSAIHGSWHTGWVAGPLDRACRPGRDGDNQRPRVPGVRGLATTIHDQEQQPDRQQVLHFVFDWHPGAVVPDPRLARSQRPGRSYSADARDRDHARMCGDRGCVLRL
jgi:hypothetical protein